MKSESPNTIVDFVFKCVECSDFSSRFTSNASVSFCKRLDPVALNFRGYLVLYDTVKEKEKALLGKADNEGKNLYKILMGELAKGITEKNLTEASKIEGFFQDISATVIGSQGEREAGGVEKRIPLLYTKVLEYGAAFTEKKALETKWFSLGLMNLDGLLFFVREYTEEGSWKESAEKIRSKLAKEDALIRAEKIKFTVAMLLAERSDEIERFFVSWGINTINKAGLINLYEIFKEVRDKGTIIVNITQWIKSSGFSIEVRPFTDETTLQEMRTTGGQITSIMRQAEVRLDELDYFVTNKSEMFMGKFKDLAGEAIEKGEIGTGLGGVNAMLDKTYAFFKRFLTFDQLTFGEFDKIDELIRRHERDFDREIKVM